MPVISDIRQPNEFETCKDRGYLIIRVNSHENNRIERMKQEGDNFSEDVLKFSTESHVDKFVVDYELYNNGSLQHLYDQIDAIMTELRVK